VSSILNLLSITLCCPLPTFFWYSRPLVSSSSSSIPPADAVQSTADLDKQLRLEKKNRLKLESGESEGEREGGGVCRGVGGGGMIGGFFSCWDSEELVVLCLLVSYLFILLPLAKLFPV